MIHLHPHPSAGQKMRIKAHVAHFQNPSFGGAEIVIEDWHDRVAGKSWRQCNGNPACLVYAMRCGFATYAIPTDDEVIYGKVKTGAFSLGHLVHVSELEPI